MIPLYHPPHREAPVASAEQRLAMLQLAVQGMAGLALDDCELGRMGTSYTIDTVRQLRDRHPQQPLCLIIGMDQFQKFASWRDWSSLPDLVHIILVDRPGLDTGIEQPALEDLYRSRLAEDASIINRTTAGAILKINVPLLEISSTRIRNLVRTGNSIKYLLPDNVINYIEQHSLYQ